MKPTADYVDALEATKQFHLKAKGYSGRFMIRYLPDIEELIRKHSAKSMLDYGCGRGAQYEFPEVQAALAGIDVTKFDPGYPPFAAEPTGQYDLVVCTQALSAIPIEDLRSWVLRRLTSLARKAVYIGERIVDAPRKQLHAHLAAKGAMPHGWSHDHWSDLIAESTPDRTVMIVLRTKAGPEQGGERMEVFAHTNSVLGPL